MKSSSYNGDADIKLSLEPKLEDDYNNDSDDDDNDDPLEDPPVYVWIMGILAFAGMSLIIRGLLCK